MEKAKGTEGILDIGILNPIFDFVLSGVHIADREDVKHDSIVRILTAMNKGAIKKDLFTFSYTVIRRTVMDYYRKKRRMIIQKSTMVHFCDGADDEKGSTVDHFYGVDYEVGYGLADVRNDYLFHKHLFTNQEQKIISYMLFTEDGIDMKPTQISNQLGLNKSHASRAMNKLKHVCLV